MPTINKGKKHIKPYKEYKFNGNGKSAKYYTANRDNRNQYIKEHPLDELQLLVGKVVAGEHVHHCVEFLTGMNNDEKMFLATLEDNLITLSEDTHKKVHNHYEQLKPSQRSYLEQKRRKVMMALELYRSTH